MPNCFAIGSGVTIELREGSVLTLYTGDEDDQAQPDELRSEDVAHYDTKSQSWMAMIDWAAVRDVSAEGSQDASQSVGSGARRA
jgi:hypothetical protein